MGKSKQLAVWIVVFQFVCLAASAGNRSLWVTRWDYKSPDDIAKIFENAKWLGANTVLFQVRGEATAFYNSSYEPWAWELSGDSTSFLGLNPGWDPLETAVNEAKNRAVEIHAWVNVFPGWRGIQPVPSRVNHPWRTNRDWFMVDHYGTLLSPVKSWYTFMSPGIAAVRTHIANVFGEIAKNYPGVDGIHMDYVRYPAHTETGGFRDFSYDAESVREFQRIYKKKPASDSKEWMEFKCAQVTDAIRGIRQKLRSISPSVELSGTFVAEIEKAHTQTGQNPEDWLGNDLVDWVVPMVYKRNAEDFTASLNELSAALGARYNDRMVIGINAAFENVSTGVTLTQIKIAEEMGFGGEALFAYSALFPNHNSNYKAKTIAKLWKEHAVRELITGNAPVYEPNSN